MSDDAVDPLPAPCVVSVVIRTRNRPRLLEEALKDVADQTFDGVEVVVVNDGDEVEPVAGVVDGFRARGGVATIIDRTTEIHGRAPAANAGLMATRGEFIVLHDDDDTWDPTFLTRTVSFLREHPRAAAVSAHTEVVIHHPNTDEGTETLERLLLTPDLTAITIPDMLRANRITTHSLLYRAWVHDEIGYFDESLEVHEDWDFYLRLIARHPIELLPLPALVQWHHRPDATGDDRNSVFALRAEHAAAHHRLADERLRSTLSEGGWGAALHLASEMQRLDERLNALAEDDRRRADSARDLIGKLETQLGAIAESVRRLSNDLVAVQRSLSQTQELVVARTSLGGLLARLNPARLRRNRARRPE